MHTYHEALSLILAERKNLGTEKVALEKANGRVLAQNIYADRDYPPFNRAAMDGYCFECTDTILLNEYKCVDTIFAGGTSEKTLQKSECFKIMTGAAVPLPANMIVRVEDAKAENDIISFSIENVNPFQNIAKQGEDVKLDELTIISGTAINNSVIGALASLGKYEVEVYKLPNVAIISTGNEIKKVDEKVSNIQIRDSNSFTIAAFLAKFKIVPTNKTLVRDVASELETQIAKALENDIIIISGGVSAGDADFIPQILKALDVNQIFHKVKIKPGKPIWFGKGKEGQIVFALPGNPVSVQVACRIFVEPFLRACFSLATDNSFFLPLAQEKKKKVKLDEFFPCKLENMTKTQILPLHFNGSGDITATLGSDGIGLHTIAHENLSKDTKIQFFPW